MRKSFWLLLCSIIVSLQLLAQTRTITGTVTDDKGATIAGVSINALGPDRKVLASAVSDASGHFTIHVPEKTRGLQFSHVGLDEQFVPLGNKTQINVSLSSTSRDLSEVVVVGYGVQKKKEVTGNLAVIKGAVVADKPIQSFEAGIAGRAPGVQITVPNGVLNSPPVFRIRGTNSISLSSYPLIVIDGVPSFTNDYSSTNAAANPLASINPNDIESIDVAKDAAATAIYGSRAANGVVFITTKKGKAGKAKVTYDGWVGFSNPYRLPSMMNAQQYTNFKNAAVANNPTQSAVQFNIATGANGAPVNTNWYDYVYRQGISQNHNVSVSGGSDNTTYYFSAGYTAQQGIIRKNNFDRLNVLFNVDSRVNKVMTVGGKISYSNEKNLAATSSGSLSGEAFNTGGLGRLALVLPPSISPYNPDGSYNINGASIGYANIVGTSVPYYNPVPQLDLNRSNNEVNHIQSNAYLQLKPLNWITLRSTYGIDYLNIDNDLFWSPVTGDGYSYNGYASAIFGKYKTWVWTNTAQFDYTFAKKHSVSLLVGSEQTRRTSLAYGINRQGLSDPNYNLIQAGWINNNATGMGYGENYLLSKFSRLNYDYNKKYFISGNLRQDEYSALGVKKGTFWGVSGRWDISKENFWSSAKLDHIFNSFSIRGSYGKVGNIAGIGDYTPYSTFASGLYGGASTLTFNTVGNPALQWETSKKTDVGFSFSVLRERLSAEVAYYRNNIDGLILNVAQAPSAGLPSNPPQNIGSMYNKGVEIDLNARIIETKDFSWSSNFNISFNTNQVTALAPGLTNIQTSTSSLETVNRTAPGYAVGYLWVVRTAGVDPQTGRRIFLNAQGNKVYYQYYAPSGQFNYSNPDGTKYVGPTGATSISQANDAVMYGNVQPKQYGGWNNDFRYKNFDLNVMFTYQLGFYVYYGTNAGLHDQRFWNNATDMLTQAWQNKGDVNKLYAKPVFGDNVSNGSAIPLDINVFKGNFVKLRNLSVGYNIPQSVLSRAKISRLRVYVSGQNLAIITKYPGPDPEVSSNGNSATAQGVDRNTAGNARTITVGLNVGF
jgi:TonB-linked SusC/RagA family outer membrane protein